MASKRQTKSSKSQDKIQNDIDELTADLQRVQADFVNFRRRTEEEKASIMVIAKESVILQLLPVIDNIERALAHQPAELKNNEWAKGVAQIAKQTEATLKEMGVKKIATAGEQFDPELHEAVGYEDGDGENEIIVEELQPGYFMGDRVIRHAMVKVKKEK